MTYIDVASFDGAHHNAACTGLDVERQRLFIGEEKSRTLQHVIGTNISPTNLTWIPLRSVIRIGLPFTINCLLWT